MELSQAESAEKTDAAVLELRRRVKAHVGVSADVSVHPPGSLPRSEGKARRVVDNR